MWKKKLKKYLRKKQKDLNLLNWDVKLKLVNSLQVQEKMKDIDNEYSGCITYNHSIQEAKIYISKEHKDKKETIRHELLHLLCRDKSIKLDYDVEEQFVNVLTKNLKK